MFSVSAMFDEFKHLIRLAAPILVAQLAIAGLGIVDTVMSGRVGTDDLAAIGLGSSVLFPVMMLSIGILLTLTPLIGKQYGKNNRAGIVRFLSQGLWLAVPLSFLTWWLLANAGIALDFLPLTHKVHQLSDDYLFYIAFGLPGLIFYFVWRFFWEGLGLTVPTMLISIAALLLNIPLNAVFIYGFGPVKAYGAAGCGIASAIVMWSMLVVGMLFVWRSNQTRPYLREIRRALQSPRWHRGMKDILALGVPNTFALLFEASLFSLIAIFIAKLGTTVIAANQVALSYTSLLFMVPLSLSLAITIRTGQAYGQGSRVQLLTRVYSGILLTVSVSGVIALMTYGFRQPISALYTENPEVIQIAVTLLMLASFYQVFDAIQVSSAGALRGLHSTQVTMWVTLVCYWGVGLGGGYVLAFTDWLSGPYGVAGFWIGIVAGFVLAAGALQIKLYLLIQRLTRQGELVG